MPSFGQASLERIEQCHPAIQKLAHHVVREFNITVLPKGGWRDPEEQLQLYEAGKSKVLVSKHNHTIEKDGKKIPWSLAMDIAPYPIDFGRTPREVLRSHIDTTMTAATMAVLSKELYKASVAMSRFYFMAGLVMRTADILNIKIRWGGDWDGDQDFMDQTFNDLAHFELVGYEDRPYDTGELHHGT